MTKHTSRSPVASEVPGITRDAPLTAGKPKVAYSQFAAAFRGSGKKLGHYAASWVAC
jgi:hypothetical protein